MIQQDRVREMTKMAIYEEGKGREELAVCRYFRSDYVGLQLVKTFFCATVAYVILAAFWALYHADDFLQGMSLEQLKRTGIWVLVFYGVFLTIFMIITFVYARIRYKKCYAGVKVYKRHLNRIVKMYDRESAEADET